MKKRILLLVLCMAMALSFVGCQPNSELVPQSDTSESGQPQDTGAQSAEKTYKDIPRETVKEYKSLYLSYGEGLRVFRFMIPETWSLTAEVGGYAIERGGNPIGSIKTGEGETDTLGASVYEEEFFFLDDKMQYAVYQKSEQEYVHRFVFRYEEKSGTQRVYTMLVKLEEMDEFAVNRILYAYRSEKASNDVAMGILFLPENPSILIIGNSFVNSSDIGNIMNSFGGVDCRAVSIGYLTVRRLCSDYTSYLSEMRAGEYDAVFLCGFYSTDDASQMETVVEACRVSGTELVVFPAHNESASAVEAASRNSYVKVLDWKSEIDTIHSKLNVPLEELRVDDQHGHSRPLAGYIGAHMIYRAIFGEVPPVRSQYGDLSHEYVQEYLGDYMTDPVIELISSDEIMYMS